MKLHFLGSLTALLLSGCVGGGVLYSHVGTHPYAGPSVHRARLVIHPTADAIPGFSKATLRAAWGEPDEIERHPSSERWLYMDGLRWNGVFIFALLPIPIPLMVPVGHDYVAITFEGELMTRIETKSEAEKGVLCPALKNIHTLELGCVGSPPMNGDIDKKFLDPNRQPLRDPSERKAKG